MVDSRMFEKNGGLVVHKYITDTVIYKLQINNLGQVVMGIYSNALSKILFK